MLVVISDLHLQHTSLDGIRRRLGDGTSAAPLQRGQQQGEVVTSEVVRNIGAPALALLEDEITANALSVNAREVHLVLAGDIFEMHRTPLWLLGSDSLRPTSTDPSERDRLCDMTMRVLEEIHKECNAFFTELQRFARARIDGAEVTVHYLPGNHDRLANAFPLVRARVRDMLGMVTQKREQAEAPFPHVLDWPLTNGQGYGTRIRHGHEYDAQNFPIPFDPQVIPPTSAYDHPVLGDFATVDVATRIALAYRAFYARELRENTPLGDSHRQLYSALTEFDDVRPAAALVRYLDAVAVATDGDTFGWLKPVLIDAFENARNDPFFLSEAKRLDFSGVVDGLGGHLLDIVLKRFPPNLIAEAILMLEKLQRTTKPPSAFAANESGIDEGTIDLVIAGHTHQPDHVGIRGTGKAYFLDSGTWRTRIDAGEGKAFGRQRSYTMTFCYDDTEVRGAKGTYRGERRRFEAWTGHLRGDAYGPHLATPCENSDHPKQTVRFLSCELVKVEGGDTVRGAVIDLTVGVDGEGKLIQLQGVHDGDQPIALPPDIMVNADPSLDGEVWCIGVAKDLGLLFHHDEPLPWALDFLPRTPPGVDHPATEPQACRRDPFTPGKRQLRARDRRGFHYVLVYEVI